MNLYLRGIGGDETNIVVDDSLRTPPGDRFDIVLTNPPFGRKSTLTFVDKQGESKRENLVVERPDFWATTSNKQLNFLQHVRSLLKIHGRAAIVVPDNVLFEGGAGETVRRKLLAECDVHHLAATTYWCVLRPGSQGQRALLRPQTCQRDSLDPRPVDLRPAHGTGISPSRPSRLHGPTWMISLPPTTRKPATSAGKLTASTDSATKT